MAAIVIFMIELEWKDTVAILLHYSGIGQGGVAQIRTQRQIAEEARRFLQVTGVAGTAFTVEDLASAMRQTGLIHGYEMFRAKGALTGTVVSVGTRRFLFFPDPRGCGLLASMQSLAHEAGHLWLRHQLRTEGKSDPGRSAADEAEAEAFARTVIAERAAFEKTNDSRSAAALFFGCLERTEGVK